MICSPGTFLCLSHQYLYLYLFQYSNNIQAGRHLLVYPELEFQFLLTTKLFFHTSVFGLNSKVSWSKHYLLLYIQPELYYAIISLWHLNNKAGSYQTFRATIYQEFHRKKNKKITLRGRMNSENNQAVSKVVSLTWVGILFCYFSVMWPWKFP